MEGKKYLNLFIVCSIMAQAVSALSDDNTKKSADLLIRKKRLVDRTLNGNRPVTLQQVSYVVAIHEYNKHTCTGTILFANVILTTAFCALEDPPQRYTILSGSAHRSLGTRHFVTEIFRHPEYHLSNMTRGNLALLRITRPINFFRTPNRPISLLNRNVPPETPVTTSGWGITNLNRFGNVTIHSVLLRSINMVTISRDECKSENENDPDVTEAVICAWDRTRQKHASNGDESNPLVAYDHLIGIMIWTRGHGYPDVYENLAYPLYQSWLVAILGRIASNRP